MSDFKKLSISYIELKEITEKRLLNRLKMKAQSAEMFRMFYPVRLAGRRECQRCLCFA